MHQRTKNGGWTRARWKKRFCHSSCQDVDLKTLKQRHPLWCLDCNTGPGRPGALLPLCSSKIPRQWFTLHRSDKVRGFFQRARHVLFHVHITLLTFYLSTARLSEINLGTGQYPAHVSTVGMFHHKYLAMLWLKQHLAFFLFLKKNISDCCGQQKHLFIYIFEGTSNIVFIL